jgi:hypothetical protein
VRSRWCRKTCAKTSLPGDFEIGRFYTKAGTPMDRLGIGQQNRVFCRFRVKAPLEALESMTAPAKDTWTVRAGFAETPIKKTKWYNGQLVGGGATQYLIPEAPALFARGELELVSSASGIGGARPSIPAKRLSMH